MGDESPQFVTTGSYPTRGGNAVRLLIDGEPAFRRICEAIEAARHRVWVTVTFMWADVQMPGGRGAPLDVLNRAARRGVDVRVIFWRCDMETKSLERNAFWGSPAQLELLREHYPKLSVRWDRAEPGFCQHQKTWLIDAGEDSECAFTGGINLNPHSMVAAGHRGEGQNHDLYLELQGPAVADVHHNFAQRWNEASERHTTDGCHGERGKLELKFPTELPEECGSVIVQIQRTTHPNRYLHGPAPVGGVPFEIARGERTNFEQYRLMIESAQRTIYIENQAVEVLEILDALRQALERGVEVLLVMPAPRDLLPSATAPEPHVFDSAQAALGGYPRFTLAGIAGVGDDGQRKPVHIHSKLMLVDDTWATIGSANLHRWSLFGNGELNAAIWSSAAVREFRIALLSEHLAVDTSKLDDLSALRAFRRIALENRRRLEQGEHTWQGLAFSLEPAVSSRQPE
jgi:cardiolipin synthase A/B